MAKILIADDHGKDLAPMLAVWLKDFKLLYEERADNVGALLGQNPDIGVVLLDLQFDEQRVQGRDLVYTIRDKYPLVQVIIFATESDVDLALKMRGQGVIHDYLEKRKLGNEIPVAELVRRINDAVDTNLRQQHLRGLQVKFIDSSGEAIIGSMALRLTNMEYALYRTTAQAAHENWPGVGPAGFGGTGWLAFENFFNPANRVAQEFIANWRSTNQNLIEAPETFHELMVSAAAPNRDEDNKDYFRDKIRKLLSPCRGHINLELKRSLADDAIVEKFKIHTKPREMRGKRVSTFGLLLEPEQIIFQRKQ